MEHEVFVPVPVPSLRRTLGDPARVARCVPGLQQDADASAGPLSGRLKVRIGSHTITYRGTLTSAALPDGAGISVEGEGVEARGSGSAKLALTIRLTETDGGTTIGFTGTAGGEGRIVELEREATLTAAHRLLDRFTQQLVTETLASHGPAADGPAGESDGPAGAVVDLAVDEAVDRAIEEAAETADETTVGESPEESSPENGPAQDDAAGSLPGTGSVFDAPVPPPSLDPVADMEFTVPDEPPAEAAHARRTMIGRSAEEVDHAPPRGRYAPVPSPDSTTAGATLRWVAPAAALALASAVVVGRALRRRR
ncbi:MULTISPECIES: SRPBCC domain-containing protein [unclassified Streptomyces]|uniref:SRPBCC domain-containing protein n=1 Tax=unclassified Streptomyces TaxID=2593676 RepID=UPI002DD7D0A5|nr:MULTISPECIES: SRPBCC domain-containing protein [unclassified Streptomyces]WSC46397.1 SRPBCC domain-containing protein [Streptomyces sp. NBC_01762]WSC54599.1 SRPBCC domain-containing protein [Streptomyces sp. NBC_01761]WSD26050.1 SRPBCC domain-containing protein [Streptomyces sp. NBC_01751]WSF85435.1 SRPBCC domain-containing protein [Streptomyces sp. NBC_01744]